MTVIENNDIKDVKTFLKQHPAVGLATANSDGKPNAALVYCVAGPSDTFEFISLRETTKSKDLFENPKACLVAFDVVEGKTAKIEGVVQEITDTNHQTELFGKVLAVSQQTRGDHLPPITQMQAGEFVFFSIQPERWILTKFL